jgi:hypothetical protein
MTETLKWTHSLLATFVLLFSIWDISHVQQKLISGGLMFVLYIFIFKISNPGVAMNLWISPQKKMLFREGAAQAV